ncbi:hypothetical protein ACJJIW_11820 [Microbulbifer sp. JMSA004]|uniref:hypothetical protein n=1 Tax=unclassified Microbulbifer TaxID=2619833 RepID=UPI00403A6FE6
MFIARKSTHKVAPTQSANYIYVGYNYRKKDNTMGICLDELRLQVIRPTLKHLRAWSQGMENLLLGTAAQESQLGFHLKQGRRHGLGIYQIQPHTHREIWDQYLIDHPSLASKVRGLASQRDFLDHPHSELTTNLRYATAIAWLIYRSAEVHKIQEEETSDVANMARLWHQHFHHGPSASPRDFECSYAQLVSGADPTDSAPRYTGAPLPEHPQAPKNSPGAGLNGQDARQPTA